VSVSGEPTVLTEELGVLTCLYRYEEDSSVVLVSLDDCRIVVVLADSAGIQYTVYSTANKLWVVNAFRITDLFDNGAAAIFDFFNHERYVCTRLLYYSMSS
jgi:hypothetical protein